MTLLRQIHRDTRGAALIEFAMLSPVLLLMLLGMFDMGYTYYTQSQLQGAVQQAARASTLEGAAASEAEIDARVEAAVRRLSPQAELTFERRSYSSFSEVGKPEDFSDINKDGKCNDGEPFEDVNGNGVWDDDRGKAGMGGARDAVLYMVTVTYPRTFGVANMAGFSKTVTMQATTVLRNQPYDEQETLASVGTCL